MNPLKYEANLHSLKPLYRYIMLLLWFSCFFLFYDLANSESNLRVFIDLIVMASLLFLLSYFCFKVSQKKSLQVKVVREDKIMDVNFSAFFFYGVMFLGFSIVCFASAFFVYLGA